LNLKLRICAPSQPQVAFASSIASTCLAGAVNFFSETDAANEGKKLAGRHAM